MNGKPPVKDIFQSILLGLLLLALLVTGSFSVAYILDREEYDTKYEALRQENQLLMDAQEAVILGEVGRGIIFLESRLFTAEKRIEALELRLRMLEQYEIE